MRTFSWDTAPMVGMPFESESVDALAASLTDVVEINCRGRGGSLVFEVENKSAIALQDFALLAKAHENGDWHTLVAGTDWSAITASAPNTLAAATHATVFLSIAPAWSIKFQAQAASATVSTIVRGTLNEAGGSAGGGSGSDAELGAVEIKDATSNARAKVVVGSSAAVGDVALAVADANTKAMLGAVGDTAAEGDAASGSVIARLRGIAKAIGTAAAGLLFDIEAHITTLVGCVDTARVKITNDVTAAAIATALMPLLKDGFPLSVTVGASALISASITFPAGTFKLTLKPTGSVPIYMAKTTASAASALVPEGGISFFVTKAVADVLAVYSASGTTLGVYVAQV